LDFWEATDFLLSIKAYMEMSVRLGQVERPKAHK
jgi:hypothetical protein